jgi:CxxC motif-containing protein (DUF1111 family)
VSDEERAPFLLGRAVFERLTAEEEGLGPLFNEVRCSGCHDVPDIGGSSATTIQKATRWEAGRCDLLEEEGGDNIQQRATRALVAAGIDGEPLPEGANATARVVAPSLFGLGLVEAIPVATLAALADPDDGDGDGISGRTGRTAGGGVGRFGRKAGFATIDAFNDTALRFELGLTTPAHPREETVGGQPLPPGVDPTAEPEIGERGIRLLGEYLRLLAAPAPREPEDAEDEARIRAGADLFRSVGCADCHVPVLETGAQPSPVLHRVPVPLYSDLLLHDLGPGLAGVCGRDASPTEHRTARLWGLRHRELLLHDGRASTPREAIAYHGGEAAASREAFQALDPDDRALLLHFLASL